MKNVFSDHKILFISQVPDVPKQFMATLDVLGFETTKHVSDAREALEALKSDKFDVAIGHIDHKGDDVLSFSQALQMSNLPDLALAVIAIADKAAILDIAKIKQSGVCDLLQTPFSLDDLKNKLKYALELSQSDIEQISESYSSDKNNHVDQWPDQEEAKSLTNVLLDHYLKHHEIVFTKLKVAQEATHECIEEVRSTYEKVREKDNTNVMGFKDFDQMWEDVLGLFMKGGLSEEDLREIEKLVSVIPKDIRSKYDMISQQDKSFLALVESLNVSAYKKAKEKVVALQALPNPLNGRTSKDYEHHNEERGKHAEAFIFKPRHRGDE